MCHVADGFKNFLSTFLFTYSCSLACIQFSNCNLEDRVFPFLLKKKIAIRMIKWHLASTFNKPFQTMGTPLHLHDINQNQIITTISSIVK